MSMAVNKRATLKDVAAACGVSITTASYVLSGRTEGILVSPRTRQRVSEVARKMGYRRNSLAAALRTGHMNVIGLAGPHTMSWDPAAPTYTYVKDLILAITFAAARAGLSTVLLAETPTHRLEPASLQDGHLDGIILFGKYDAEDWVKQVYATRLPCVEIGSRFGPNQVHVDNFYGTRLAVEHLVGLGHRRIAHLTPRSQFPMETPAAEMRIQGFRAATQDAGITPEAAPILYAPEEVSALLRSPDRPTALFTFNDERAFSIRKIVRDAGLRIPDDLSIVGFDDEIRAYLYDPPLTTVKLPLNDMADAAVQLIQAQIAGVAEPENVRIISTHLVVRETTAPV